MQSPNYSTQAGCITEDLDGGGGIYENNFISIDKNQTNPNVANNTFHVLFFCVAEARNAQGSNPKGCKSNNF